MKKFLASAFLVMMFRRAPGQAADNMKAFPPAEPGMVRHVVQLPAQADESAFKVELIVGKTVQLEAGNRYFFAGKSRRRPSRAGASRATRSPNSGRWPAR